MLCEGRQKSSEKTLRQQNEYLALLHQTALSLVNQLDLDAVLNRIVISAARLVGTPNGCIFLLDKDKGIFIRTHGVGVYEHDIGATRTLEEGLIGIVYKTAAPAQVGQYSGWQKRVLSPIVDQIHAMLQVPLKSGQQVVGAIGLAYLEDGETFGEEEVEILSRFAELASIALENARLHTAQQAELAERQKAEEALISSEANNKALLAAVPDTIFRFNRQGVLLDFRLGREPVSWILPAAGGSSISAVMSPQMAQNILRHALLAEQSGGIMEFEYSVGDGTAWEVRIGTSGRGEFLAIVRNVTERREMQSRLEYLSMHDALTGLFNRYRFEQEMFRLSKGGGRAGMIICDVDGLKFINDSLGHEAGDALLKTTGTILREVFAAEDIAARVGGDEFAILLPNRSHSEVEQDCRRLQKSVDSHNRENPGLPLSISIGFAASSEELAEMSSLYKEADNYMYREKLHRKTSIRSSIVQALMKAMEVRDYATQGHAQRLEILTVRLAARLRLPDHSIGDLRLLAQFHDIGKVGIPDRILSKAGPLTDKERLEMRRHSEVGFRLAQSIPELVPIADWILKHHEWWNGQGYPLGLQRQEIPLESRIIAVVDSFDAMTSDRPYRKAMSLEEALAELVRCSGTQFDPDIVPLFVEIVAEDRTE